MLAIKKKTILIIIVITTVTLGGLALGINLLTKSDDENIVKYKEALRASVENEYYHYLLESRFENEDEGAPYNLIEYYRSGANYLRMDKYYESDLCYATTYELVYNEKTYNLNSREDVVDVAVHDYVNPTNGFPNGIDSTYYSINDKNVTYEEVDTQMIVTYENKWRIGKPVDRSSMLEESDGYKSAVSVAYFDKEWNLQKLEITEKWDCITEAGKKEERVLHYILTYQETSNEEIDKKLEDVLNEIKTMLKEQ